MMTSRTRFFRVWSGAVLVPFLLPAFATAQAGTDAATAVTAPTRQGGSSADTLTAMVSLGLGLLAVVALIFACAWLLRRMHGLTGVSNQSLKVVSVMALGARERIALIDVAGTQILVGITPTAIRTLHVFDEPVVTADSKAASGDFARRLQGLMGRQWPGNDRSGGEGS